MADSSRSGRRTTIVLKTAAAIGIGALVMKAFISQFSLRSIRRNRSLAKHQNAFCIPDATVSKIVKDFEEQLSRGLLTDGPSSLQMLPSWITTLPTGDETGEYYAIDVGGTNLRVMHCVLGEGVNQVLEHDSREIEIPANRKSGKIQNLFDFIVASFRIFLQLTGRNYDGQKLHIGFCFSFPMETESPTGGTIKHMTKDYAYEDAAGKDVVQILSQTFARFGFDAEIQVLCNDAIGVLAAGKYADPRAEIGVVLGTGTNASCIETVGQIQKWVPGLPNDVQTAVNTEWGAFVSEFLPRSEEDDQLDTNSSNPGEYLFEKMISGQHVGELCRLLLVSISREGNLPRQARLGELIKPYALSTRLVGTICADQSSGLRTSASMLKTALRVDFNPEQMQMVKSVCEMVVDRAALLVGCGLSATIAHVRRDAPGNDEAVVVTVDGSMFIKFEKFRKAISTETKRILTVVYGAQAPKFEIMPYLGGSCFGAAALSAAACPTVDESCRQQFPELRYLDY